MTPGSATALKSQPLTKTARQPNGPTLNHATRRCTIRLWDALSGECLRTMRASRLGDFATVQHHADGDELIAVSPGAFRSFFWDPMPGTRVPCQE
ncbi:MAG: hypothetical protein ACPGXX_14110 [Planctomycetaceae bacterium]